MKYILVSLFLFACSSPELSIGQVQQALDAGGPHCPAAPYEVTPALRSTGLSPADTSGFDFVYTPDMWAYVGNDSQRVEVASIQASKRVTEGYTAAVLFDRVYELTGVVHFFGGVTYTGGGLRRKCDAATAAPLYMFILIHAWNNFVSGYVDGVVIDSVLFDGNDDCGETWGHDWLSHNTADFRGDSVIRNSAFVQTPSENITACGGTFVNNIAQDLGGSFVHISCTATQAWTPIVLKDNHVRNVVRYGQAVSGHAEGAVTFSANSGNLFMSGNTFDTGQTGVFGNMGGGEMPITAVSDCYEGFPRLGTTLGGFDPEKFVLRETEQINVGPLVPYPTPY